MLGSDIKKTDTQRPVKRGRKHRRVKPYWSFCEAAGKMLLMEPIPSIGVDETQTVMETKTPKRGCLTTSEAAMSIQKHFGARLAVLAD